MGGSGQCVELLISGVPFCYSIQVMLDHQYTDDELYYRIKSAVEDVSSKVGARYSVKTSSGKRRKMDQPNFKIGRFLCV